MKTDLRFPLSRRSLLLGFGILAISIAGCAVGPNYTRPDLPLPQAFMQPFTILAALPLSIGGAFILLLVTGKSFSMPSLIGLLMLMGVATKNSILLVDYVIMARRDLGMNRFDALIDACHKRARPIIMTTLAMGFGMLPIALGFGADPSFRSPMAVAVIGGLITSTVLSLVVVPAVYTYVDDLEHVVKRLWNKRPGDHQTLSPKSAVRSPVAHGADD